MVYLRGKVWYMRFERAGTLIHRSTGKTNEVEAKAVELLTKQEEERKSFSSSFCALNLSSAIDKAYQERWKDQKSGRDSKRKAYYLLDYLPDKELHLITDEDVLELRDKLLEKHKPATVADYLTYLRTILSMARDKWHVISSLPYFPVIKVRNRRLRTISREEEASLLLAADPVMRDLLIVLLDTGSRLGEGLTLKASEINLSTSMAHIWESKSGSPRSVPVTDRVKEVFARREKFNLTISQAEKRWSAVKRKAGILDPTLVLHSARHTYASRLVEAGVDLYRVKQLLGHHSITQTERYAHLSPASKDILEALSN